MASAKGFWRQIWANTWQPGWLMQLAALLTALLLLWKGHPTEANIWLAAGAVMGHTRIRTDHGIR
jgi:hypothetical protein